MTYTAEQLAIIRRIGEISAQHDATMAAQRTAHAAAANSLLNIGRELLTAVEFSHEIGALQKAYGDAFREFLDTLE